MSRDIPNLPTHNNPSIIIAHITDVLRQEEIGGFDIKYTSADWQEVLDSAAPDDYVIFMREGDDFTKANSLSRMMRAFKNPFAKIVYSDSYIMNEKFMFPAFDLKVIEKKVVINFPFVYKVGRKNPKMTDGIMSLYSFLLNSITPNGIPFHVPELLIKQENHCFSQEEIDLL
jgi:hypothetical protein